MGNTVGMGKKRIYKKLKKTNARKVSKNRKVEEILKVWGYREGKETRKG
jgi:hypothetical protein